jgi:hypothetical protein
MTEILFMVEEQPDGGWVAHAVGQAIVTEADDLEELEGAVREAVLCHFDDGEAPKVIRLER